MPPNSAKCPAVARFPAVDFGSFEEFNQYYRSQKPTIDLRWRYEQSLATTDKQLVTYGTCGVCLVPSVFTSTTSEGSEVSGVFWVPNWRENLVCNCELVLINRERALLHFLLERGALQPWMLVFACGELGGLRHLLPDLTGGVTEMESAALNNPPSDVPGASQDRRQRHLFLWVESLDRNLLSHRQLSSIAARLTLGGRFVFTAPFDASAPHSEPISDVERIQPSGQSSGTSRFIGWDILEQLRNAGFQDARASMFWSDEFGYLGPMNFIFSAVK